MYVLSSIVYSGTYIETGLRTSLGLELTIKTYHELPQFLAAYPLLVDLVFLQPARTQKRSIKRIKNVIGAGIYEKYFTHVDMKMVKAWLQA